MKLEDIFQKFALTMKVKIYEQGTARFVDGGYVAEMAIKYQDEEFAQREVINVSPTTTIAELAIIIR